VDSHQVIKSNGDRISNSNYELALLIIINNQFKMKIYYQKWNMKCSSMLLLITVFISGFSSCSYRINPIAISHGQIMASYDTKEKIRNTFGIPTLIRTVDRQEQWYYDWSKIKLSDTNISSDNYTGTLAITLSGRLFEGTYGNDGQITSGSSFYHSKKHEQIYRTFIKFTLEENTPVIWQTKGVDFTQNESIKRKVISKKLVFESGALFLLLTVFLWVSN
jgi:hypothetical protein